MYATIHQGVGVDHIHVTLEHGPHAGTWEVRYEPGAVWRVRSPKGVEHILEASSPWIGDLGVELGELMRKIAPRAVTEAIRRVEPTAEEVHAEPVGAYWPEGVAGA